MAIRTIVTCDVHADDATPGDAVRLGLFGSEYELDLCDEHRDELVSLLEPYLELARADAPRQGARSGAAKSNGSRRSRGKSDNSAVRAWAREQGFEVSDRGRIPAEIVAQYEAAQKGSSRGRRKSK